MPIYAYKCASCGHAKDVLQKMSDAPLTVCPSCGAPAFSKQVTAAGFQLKGSGWYVTDFRGGSQSAPSTDSSAKSSESGSSGAASAPAPAAAPAPASAPAPAPASAPAGGGTSSTPSAG
ncbi:FmdB family zinc ribbon protein [Ottowia caeni]|uniref:FmdB family zinc ribbon protein n=1 Tax=Ottowia caeni TaxID=2870339 RepID=UPI001E562D4F|nr:zinc ribbon domain-containing protein [Ottowia caeni]